MKTSGHRDEISEAQKEKLLQLAADGCNLDEIAKNGKISAWRLGVLYNEDKEFRARLTCARRIALHPFIKAYFDALLKMGEYAFARRDKALMSGIDRYIGRLEWLIQRAWPELFVLQTPQAQVQEIAAAANETITDEQAEKMVQSIALRQARLAELERKELAAREAEDADNDAD